MNITIIAVGKLKEKYLKQAVEEYQKRLQPLAKTQVIEVADEKTPDGASEKEKQLVKQKEGERILSKLASNMYVIALEPKGTMITSEKMAGKVADLALHGKSKMAFVIGGSLGLDEKVANRADFLWSFSPLTFPHQLMRVMLLEQIYRSFQINRGTPYHK
ncbi:23S rRNA (pseudouridine1915-N3)-methyltransferase [Alteribacillus persepolensis]|uniref:Ribosomal RNA large subunit methyltransferase H n=1 Tax=Alteribacillus persepolensis TaxID=568899 RepID=A0A1G8G7E2_9BACI|nr:23S rRNA (pseudouridine(1915)-N(3))-methyltransferase RlmH [Alteribacillus persepolensis]SDH90307.1 23S rRNA (pseudouridine1915-N3)-methyltransferase [Alteribacillus persepolensis]